VDDDAHELEIVSRSTGIYDIGAREFCRTVAEDCLRSTCAPGFTEALLTFKNYTNRTFFIAPFSATVLSRICRHEISLECDP
jgi:hypothetical protein